MDVKEIAEVNAVPAVYTPPTEPTQSPAPDPTAQGGNAEIGISALRPVIKIDSDGLAILQLQDTRSGEVVLQVPSEEAARQYRERDAQDGAGAGHVEQVVASASGAIGAAAAVAAATAPQPASPPVQAKGVETPQAVKAVEPQTGGKQPTSVRVKA